MPANISSMIYVGNVPWHGLGVRLETPPTSAGEIINRAGLDWTTAATPMYSQLHTRIPNFHAIYREDLPSEENVLGVVDIASDKIKIVQNSDTFYSIESLLGKEVQVETAAGLDRGKKVFGCFKIGEEFKLVDDEVTHYLLIVNDHLKPDGKVIVMNTPVRVVCQNTLSAALNGTMAKYRISCSTDTSKNQAIAMFVKENVLSSQKALTKSAEKMLSQKITRESVERLLDELFPYIKADEGSLHDRANETTSMVRETFLTKCMDADNLQNYKGTQYQVFNALTDFSQHYFMSSEHGVDMERRMNESMSSNHYMSKYQKIAPKLIA